MQLANYPGFTLVMDKKRRLPEKNRGIVGAVLKIQKMKTGRGGYPRCVSSGVGYFSNYSHLIQNCMLT